MAARNVFWTPSSEEEMQEYLDRYSGAEKALVIQTYMITVNYMTKLAKDNAEK